METNHLRYFLAIIETGSLSATAKKLRLSQPALSSAVQSLEKIFGTTLLIRDHNGVVPTRTGEQLKQCAQDVLARLDDAQARIRRLEGGSEGTFVIGCHESLGAYFMPEFLASFLQAEPRIEVSLWNGTSAAVQQAVLARTVDFGLVVNPHPADDLVISDLCEDAVDLFVAATVDATAAPGTTLDSGLDLAAATARLLHGPILYAGRVYQAKDLLSQLESRHLLSERRISCGDLELVKSMTLANVGVGVLPRRVAAYGQHGRLRRLHAELPSYPDRICMIYRADLHRTRGTMALKNALLQHGRLLDARGDGFTAPRVPPQRDPP